ncbi:MAG TPA: hypothetical protein VFA58_07430 [Chthoniobacterales bacterium]|nr:hypothetical protein [Chthoniobacterales bacterium]
MIAVLILSGCVVAGFVLGLVATATAPMGYQDEGGFHYGPVQATREEELPAGAAPQAKPA